MLKKATKHVSRVLCETTIYLGSMSPSLLIATCRDVTGRHMMSLFAVLLRIGFAEPHSLPCAGELLPRLSTLTGEIPGGISLLHFP